MKRNWAKRYKAKIQIKLAPEDYDGAEQGYLKVMDTLPPEQEQAIKTYCDMVFVSGARTEEFYYRQGLKDGINLKHTMKKVLRSEVADFPDTEA